MKGEFQPSRTGMYQFLMDGEHVKAKEALRLVLLDESNLSPIEHYWSDFIAMCDKDGRDRPIRRGGGEIESIQPLKNNNLRFISTINNDSTTEPLSPRLIDRAPVITLDFPYGKDTDGNIIDDLHLQIGNRRLESAFGRTADCLFEDCTDTPGLELTEEEIDLRISDNVDRAIQLNIITEFIEAASEVDSELGDVICVSGRKEKAIGYYLAVATKFMDDVTAQDFAVAQYILPIIRGEGSPFKNRLRKMCDLASRNKMELTRQVLERIITQGDSYLQSYSFV